MSHSVICKRQRARNPSKLGMCSCGLFKQSVKHALEIVRYDIYESPLQMLDF